MRGDLYLADEVQIIHELEGLGDAAPDRQQAMIAQEQDAVIAEIGDQALALIEIAGDPFIFVDADRP